MFHLGTASQDGGVVKVNNILVVAALEQASIGGVGNIQRHDDRGFVNSQFGILRKPLAGCSISKLR